MIPRLLLIACLACALFKSENSFGAEANPLLSGVISVLPDIPLVVNGDLLKKGADGKIVTTYRVEMVLDWKADVPTARYTIRDAFGSSLEHLAITWVVAGEPEYRYFTGHPLSAAPLPPLNQAILDTDITWLDLSLSFLWWQGGDVQGTETVRGRLCNVVDVPAPENQVADFDGVRLWIESKIGIVLRAEGYGENGELIRRMDVKSFKKIRKHWVIKDIEFQTFPEKTKTSLLVRDVLERERFDLPERDSRPDYTAPNDETDAAEEEVMETAPEPLFIDTPEQTE